jgi:diacylglycerol kinase (ATP)
MATATAPVLSPSPFAPVAPAHAPRRLRSLSPHLLLVANGNASGLHRRPGIVSDSARLLRSAGARVETLVTTELDELELVLAGADRRVVLLGGDGSLHAAANTPGPKPELALIPGGKANNVARSLGVPLELDAAARLAVEGRAHPIDAIAARTPTRTHLAVEGVSVGFHALARSQYRAANSADTAAGIRAGLGALARFEPITMAVGIDGSCELMRLTQLFVVNMPLFGPGLRVAPSADPSDGALDVVALEGPDRFSRLVRLSLLSQFARLRRGTHLGTDGVRSFRAESVRISTRGASPVIADTTDLGSETVDLTVVPHALEVVGRAA